MKVNDLKNYLDKVDGNTEVMICTYEEIADFCYSELGTALLVTNLSIARKEDTETLLLVIER